MSLKRLFTAIILFAACLAHAQKDGIRFLVDPKLDSVLDEGHKQNKRVFVDMYTDWCVWCKIMDKECFTQKSVGDFYNANFICVKINAEKGSGPQLLTALRSKGYPVNGYPTYFFLENDTQVVDCYAGAILDTVGKVNPTAFIAFGEKSLDPNGKTFPEIEKAFRNGSLTSEKDLIGYMERKQNLGMKADSAVDAFFVLHTDRSDSIGWYIVSRFASVSAHAFQYVVRNREIFDQKYSRAEVDSILEIKYEDGLYDAIYDDSIPDTAAYMRLRRAVIQLHAPFSKTLPLETDMMYYLKLENWPEYIKATEAYIPVYESENCWALNDAAWYFLQHATEPQQLNEALAWSKHAVKLNATYNNMDTYARCLEKQGKRCHAKRMAKKAIRWAKKHNAGSAAKADGVINYTEEKVFLASLRIFK